LNIDLASPEHLVDVIRIGPHDIPLDYAERATPVLRRRLDLLSPDRVVIISDETVWSLHSPEIVEALAPYNPVTLLMESGEAAKSFSTLEHLCERAVEAGATRRSVIVAFGGGVVGNTAGLMASLLFRGVRLLHVPSTLLAACDSVVSLKSAINSRRSKNAFGTYIAPQGIIVLPHLMDSLPQREVLSGIAELVKAALITGPCAISRLASLLSEPRPWSGPAWRRLVEFGVNTKRGVVAGDPNEGNEALIFEYGHTVGHAVELADTHRRGPDGLSHGAAVAIGMHVAARIAERMGLAGQGLAQRHRELMEQAGLSVGVPDGLDLETVVSLVLRDNKRGRCCVGPEEVPMILLEQEGRCVRHSDSLLVPVPLFLLRQEVACS
jgi:3-dehydroquinate synthase/2-deoxy-scyllo-inosose synthase